MARKPKDTLKKTTTKKKTSSKKEQAPTCKYCKTELTEGNFFMIYNLAVATDKEMRFIGLQKLLDDLSEYAMKKGYHISASQIVLLRPDILKDFLSLRYNNEKIICFVLSDWQCCNVCFKEYKELVPLV